MTATTFAKADLDKYIASGKHLNADEVKMIALQGMAMAIAMHSIAPKTKAMMAELEGSAYAFGTKLRANNLRLKSLTAEAEMLATTKDFKLAQQHVNNEKAFLDERIKILDQIEAVAKQEAATGVKPKGGGIAEKIKMDAAELGALRTDLQSKLATVKDGDLPLINLEPIGPGLFTCPKATINEVVKSVGEVVSSKQHPESTAIVYEVKTPDGKIVKIMEKIDPVNDWMAALNAKLGPKGKLKLAVDNTGKTPKEIFEKYKGNLDAAYEAHKTTGEEATGAKTTVDMFVPGIEQIPADKRWAHMENPANWSAERKVLHDRLIAKAKVDAQAFADAAQKGQPTMYAMRGNTAAGKTRAVSGGVPDLAGPMAATKDAPYRAVNPDAFKPDLIAATPGAETSSAVHMESSMLATRLQKELLTMKTSDGKEAGSILIDKRLMNLSDVTGYQKMAAESGRKFVLYDVDAPMEVSLAGVLERQPGGPDPLPGFETVKSGFDGVRGNRKAVVDKFTGDPAFGTYELFATKANGDRVPVAAIKDGALTIKACMPTSSQGPERSGRFWRRSESHRRRSRS